MGLGFNVEGYDCNSKWSYTSFNDFRKKISQSIGIDLDEMEGYRKRHSIDKDYIKVGSKAWSSIKSPLKYLFNHSDCDGKLTSKECKIISPILKVIIDLWEDDENEIINRYKQNGFALVAAMEYCAEFNKELIFC